MQEGCVKWGPLAFYSVRFGGKLATLSLMVGKAAWGRSAKTRIWRSSRFPERPWFRRCWLPFGLTTVLVDVGHWRLPVLGWRLPFAVQLVF